MQTLFKTVSFLLVLACLLFNMMEAARAGDKTVDKSNLTILGLVIGDCTSQDIYSKLGPGIPFKDEANPNVTQLCYVSNNDDTLILFSFKNSQCARFKMMSQKIRFYKRHFCEKSPLVSKHLATGSSIKLGMSKSRLKATLGAPRHESDENMEYVYEWIQKRNTLETERGSQDLRNAKGAPHRKLKTIIRVEFSDAKLISFDVLKYSQY
jgi:hypothetical protein